VLIRYKKTDIRCHKAGIFFPPNVPKLIPTRDEHQITELLKIFHIDIFLLKPVASTIDNYLPLD